MYYLIMAHRCETGIRNFHHDTRASDPIDNEPEARAKLELLRDLERAADNSFAYRIITIDKGE